MDNILVVQMARMGDFLQTTPLLCGIKKAYPGATLHVLVDNGIVATAAACPFVDRCHGIAAGLITESILHEKDAARVYGIISEQCGALQALAVDTVYNLNYSPLTAVLAGMPRARQISGYALADSREHFRKTAWFAFFNSLIRHMPLAPFNLVDFLFYLGGQPEHRPQQLSYSPDREACAHAADLLAHNGIDDSGAVVLALQLGTRHMQRQWPAEYYAQTARAMLDQPDIRILLLGTADDAAQGSAFMALAAGWERQQRQRVINLIGKTTVAQLAGVLMRSNLLLSGDTGTMHLAAAVGTGVLGLFFGPAYAHFTGPYGPEHWVLQARTGCGPCVEDSPSCSDFHCQRTIQPRHVIAVAEHLLLRAPLALPDDDAVQLLRSGFDRWGIRYEPLRPQQPSQCGRVMSPRAGDDDARLCADIDRIVQQSRILEHQLHAHRHAPLSLRIDPQFTFWHPWIDFYEEMLRHGDDTELAGAQAQSLFASGLSAGAGILNRVITQ